jgi:hypothetical protein
MTKSSMGRGVFKYLTDDLLGETNLPAEWEGFTPYDKTGALSTQPNKPFRQTDRQQ